MVGEITERMLHYLSPMQFEDNWNAAQAKQASQ
jgi:hypothetical protein